MKYQIKQIIHEELTKQQISKICELLFNCEIEENKGSFGSLNLCDDFAESLNKIIPVIKIYISGLGLYTESNRFLFDNRISSKEDMGEFVIALTKEILNMNEFVEVKSNTINVSQEEYDILLAINTIIGELNNIIKLIKTIFKGPGKNCNKKLIMVQSINMIMNGDYTFNRISMNNKIIEDIWWLV